MATARYRSELPPRGIFSSQIVRPGSVPTRSSFVSATTELHSNDSKGSPRFGGTGRRRSRRPSQAEDNPSERLAQPEPAPPPPPPSPMPTPGQRVRVQTVRRSSSPQHTQHDATSSAKSPRRSYSVSSKDKSSVAAAILNGVVDEQAPRSPVVPSVHPVDTLAKKLRQQAEELTHVYEQLAEQTAKVADYKTKLREQSRELERLRLKQPLMAPISRPTIASRAKGAAVSASSEVSTKAKTAALERKLHEAELEKKRYHVASKQLEKVMVDVQLFLRDRHGPTAQAESEDGDEGERITMKERLEEQQLYIRVLEEVVHLKASEFQISSHEELLVVLAELRHTIYEQEKELEERKATVSIVQEQLFEAQRERLAIKEEIEQERLAHTDAVNQMNDREFALKRQLDDIQSEFQKLSRQFNEEQQVSTAVRQRMLALEQQLARETETSVCSMSRVGELTRASDEANKRLAEVTANYEEAVRMKQQWEVEAARKQTHLDELNTLQEELLESIDEHSRSAEAAKAELETAQRDLKFAQQSELAAQRKLEELKSASGNELERLQQLVEDRDGHIVALDGRCQALEKAKSLLETTLGVTQRQVAEHHELEQAARHDLEKQKRLFGAQSEAIAEIDAALRTALTMMATNASPPEDNTTMEPDVVPTDPIVLTDIRICCAGMNSLLTGQDNAGFALMPALPKVFERLWSVGTRLIDEFEQTARSWTRERGDLLQACADLEDACQLCQHEMSERHCEVLELQHALSECSLQVETAAIEADGLREQLAFAQTLWDEKCLLERHVAEQNADLENKDTVISDLGDETEQLRSAVDALNGQLVEREVLLERQQHELQDTDTLRQRVDELANELHDALALSEEQNVWNEQLSAQLEHQEQVVIVQSSRADELEVRERTLTRRVAELVEQYAASTDNWPFGADQQLDTHDVLQLLQVLPAAVEAYAAACSSIMLNESPSSSLKLWNADIQFADSPRKPTARRQPLQASPKARSRRHCNQESQIRQAETETAFNEQLALVRSAFKTYKHDPVASTVGS